MRHRWENPATRVVLVVLLVCVFVQLGFAGGNLWTYRANNDLKWQKLTAAGTVVVGSDDGLVSLDPETGKVSWKREDLRDLPESQVEEVAGTPFLLVSKNEGMINGKAALFALNILDGTTIWQSEKLKGAAIGFFTVYEKDTTVVFTSRSQSESKTTPGMTAYRLSTGEVIWEGEFADKVDLHTVENPGKYFVHYDLSGHQPPIADDSSMYISFAGIHRYDIATGKLLWSVPYDVTEGKIKKGNAQCVIDGDTVYTSAKGQLRAVDKETGKVKWTSPDFGSAIAEMIAHGNLIYGRIGGTFYDMGGREWKLKKPLGVVAVSKNSGQAVWRYDKTDDAITNMVFLPEQNVIMVADAKNLIGIDVTGEGKATEVFRTPVEFKTQLGAGAAALKVARFGLGGIRGGLKGLSDDKKAADIPISIIAQPNGTVVVRGRQHILGFDPRTKQIPWSIQFAAPGLPNWQKFVMISIYAMNYMYATSAASHSYYGTSTNTSANNTRQQMIENFTKVLNKRFSATRASGEHVHILTSVDDGKDKGPGLIGVNMQTGQPDYSLLLKDKEPEYVVDELTGRLFNMKGKELQAYSIR